MGLYTQTAAAIWLFLTLTHYATSAPTFETRELGFADYPQCSIACTIPALPASGCAMTDMNCICRNKPLQETIGECLLANCSMADIEKSAKVTASLCHLPNDSQRTELYKYTITTHVLTAITVILRLGGKFVAGRLSWDDAVLGFTWMMDLTLFGIRLAILPMGLGEHTWNISGNLKDLLRIWYVGAVFYIVIIGTLKVCVVLFYLDIFQKAYPRFRLAAYSVLTYIVLNTLILLFLTIFACRPIRTWWNRDIKGTCLNIPAIGYAVGVSAIVQDIVLLILPLTMIRTLTMDRARKFSTGLLFGIGAFGCIATILRLHTNPYIKVSLDPTWDYSVGMIWVELEITAIFLCISLPSIRILLVRILPARCKKFLSRLFSWSGGDKYDDGQRAGFGDSPQKKPSAGSVDEQQQQRAAPRGFFSRILPTTTSLWSRITASTSLSGSGARSRGLFSSHGNESTTAITRSSTEMESNAELQESFQLFKKYWNREMDGRNDEEDLARDVKV